MIQTHLKGPRPLHHHQIDHGWPRDHLDGSPSRSESASSFGDVGATSTSTTTRPTPTPTTVAWRPFCRRSVGNSSIIHRNRAKTQNKDLRVSLVHKVHKKSTNYYCHNSLMMVIWYSWTNQYWDTSPIKINSVLTSKSPIEVNCNNRDRHGWGANLRSSFSQMRPWLLGYFAPFNTNSFLVFEWKKKWPVFPASPIPLRMPTDPI